jgi:hypothetical protein
MKFTLSTLLDERYLEIIQIVFVFRVEKRIGLQVTAIMLDLYHSRHYAL